VPFLWQGWRDFCGDHGCRPDRRVPLALPNQCRTGHVAMRRRLPSTSSIPQRTSALTPKLALAGATTMQLDAIVLGFGCDGETTAQLKGHEQTQHLPVICAY